MVELDLNNEFAAKLFVVSYPSEGRDPLDGFTVEGVRKALNRLFRRCDHHLSRGMYLGGATYYQKCEFVLRGLLWGLHGHGAELARVLIAYPERREELLAAFEYRREITTWFSQSLMNEVRGLPPFDEMTTTMEEDWDPFIKGMIGGYRTDRTVVPEIPAEDELTEACPHLYPPGYPRPRPRRRGHLF
ncbi:hypothetical protein [Neorhizobium tomejilense]|uniref:hypothetical protein n=1 Tax=Neorhizobium tomejilense TaxID=2093828 RepID=UPI003ED0D4F0